MELQFEQGDRTNPRGHALVYFRDGTDSDRAAATYVVLLPVSVDMAKYVPPFLAGQMEAMGNPNMSSFAFPPAPEPIQSVDWVQRMATARGDDLIYGGTAVLDDAARLMGTVGEITAEYSRLYSEAQPSEPEEDTGGGETGQPEFDDVMYSLMSEPDLLAELAGLVGRLRFAVESGDHGTVREAEMKIRAIGRNVPDNRQIDRLADAAADTSPRASELAQLYVERAYGLMQEDYLRVQTLDDRISALEQSQGDE